MRQSALLSLIASSVVVVPALALPTGTIWVEIPIVDSPDDPTDLTGYRSFDLYLFVEPGDTIEAADFGYSGAGDLFSTQDVFQHPFGSDTEPHELFEDVFPDIVYDTFVALGDLDGTNGEINVTPPLDTSDPMNITAAWARAPSSPAAGPGGGVFPDGKFLSITGSIWLGRFTISSKTDYAETNSSLFETIEGHCHVIGDGPNGEFGGPFQAHDGEVIVYSPYGLSTPPGPQPFFDMLSPLDGDPLVDANRVVLDWEFVEPNIFDNDDAEYFVCVTTDFRHWNNIVKEIHLPDHEYTIEPGLLSPCTTYYWHAYATNHSFFLPALNWRDGVFTTTFIGDINKDGAVDTADLGQLIADFSTSEAASDINGDGAVDTVDLGQLIANFGLICD